MQNLYTHTGYSTQRDGNGEPYTEAYASDVHNQRRENVHIYIDGLHKSCAKSIYIYIERDTHTHAQGTLHTEMAKDPPLRTPRALNPKHKEFLE